MRRLILGVKLGVPVVWTGLCLGAYGLLNLMGDELIRNADILPVAPEGVEFASRLLAWIQTLGLGLVIGVWALGLIAFFAIGWAIHRLSAASGPMPPSTPPRHEPEPARQRSEPET